MRPFIPFRGPLRIRFSLMQHLFVWLVLTVVFSHITSANAEISTGRRLMIRNNGREQSTIEQAVKFLRRSVPIDSLVQLPDQSQCASVHQASDQCTWILENCEDQDSGLLSYLELYYCRLPQAKPVAMTIIVVWLAILFSTIGITASDYFSINLSTISTVFGLSESVAGVTLLAFGNGSPDVFSTWAAMGSNSGSLAIGELIGAAGFITAIVAGSMAIVRPFKVAKKSFIRDLGFFIVATAFSLGFLVDGHLELWEAIVMVAFYVFYVLVVMIWHWRSKKRKAVKARDVLARQHFLDPQYSDNPADEGDEEDGAVGGRNGHITDDEFAILERSEARNFDDDNEDDEVRDRYLAEITTNMRINRPRVRSRENSRQPIRPSLVGALEFRAVLSSLEQSRNHLSIPLYMRRYSEDAVTGIGQQNRLNRANSDLDPIAIPPPQFSSQEEYRDEPMSARPRAVSTNALDDVRTPNRLPPITHLPIEGDSGDETRAGLPRLTIPSEEGSRSSIPATPQLLTTVSAERPPQTGSPISPTESSPTTVVHNSATSLDVSGPIHPSSTHQEHLSHGVVRSESDSLLTSYHDDPRRGRESSAASLVLPEPLLQDEIDLLPRGPISWWPYKVLPAPEELLSTLFPTLYNWSSRGWSQRALGIITAPSVFLLNITLPVVELSREDSDEKTTEAIKTSRNDANQGSPHKLNARTPTIQTQDEHGQIQSTLAPTSDSQSNPSGVQTSLGWNRWLLCTQLVFSPMFVITVMWAQFDDDHDLKSFLFGLALGVVFSLLALPAVLFTSSEKSPPRYRTVFCILGFVVSVSWISTIANEVVGILKALGIILNISEAILGLTVFAVGSSLGDLVADITIARLGYPMMALSACFGGPMLNILLGIGVSGIWLLVQRSDKYHHKHPDRPVKYKSYHIAIDRTLVVSSVALLITLIGLAIAVPLNGWRMSRRIGWVLVAIWVIATMLNLGIEIGGWGKFAALYWM